MFLIDNEFEFTLRFILSLKTDTMRPRIVEHTGDVRMKIKALGLNGMASWFCSVKFSVQISHEIEMVVSTIFVGLGVGLEVGLGAKFCPISCTTVVCSK